MVIPGQGETRLITFYSYKGGVGRTMALANAACQLAIKHGKNVICVDWDLEAPGLHHYFGYSNEELAGRAGLLDYLLDFVWQIEHRGAQGQEPDLRNYLQPLKPNDQEKITAGSVRLMHCGRTDPNYMLRVQKFDWEKFYAEQNGYRVIETLKQQWRDEADMVLIDARAGQADVGLTPTIQIPDAVVILFASNRQSLEGAETIARRLAKHPQRLEQDLQPPKVLLVPARVFAKAEAFERWMKDAAVPVFERLANEKVLSKLDQPKGVWECVLPVDARYSVGEGLPVLEWAPVPSALKEAYVKVGQALENLYQGRDAWSVAAPGVAREPDSDLAQKLREYLRQASDRGDAQQVALLQFRLAQEDIELRRFEEAEAMLEAALAYSQGGRDQRAVGSVLHEMGNLRSAENRFEEAWVLHERALTLKEETGDVRGQGITLHDMGNVRRDQKRYDEAWALYERALTLKEEAGDVRGQGITLHEMGIVRREQRRYDEAWELCERAVSLHEEAGHLRAQGITLHEMGTIRLRQKRYDEAWALCERSLKLHDDAGNVREKGVMLHELGNIRRDQGCFDEAWALYERALSVAEEARDVREQGTTLHDMGNVRAQDECFEEAWALYERALKLKEQARDVREQAVTLYEMGNVRRKQKRYDEAWALYERALELAERAGDVLGEAATLHAMGLFRVAEGKTDEAEPILQRGLSKALAVGDEEGIGHCQAALADCEKRAKKQKARAARGKKRSGEANQ